MSGRMQFEGAIERAFVAMGRRPILVLWVAAQALLAFWWAYFDRGDPFSRIGYFAALSWLLAPGSWVVWVVFAAYDAVIGIQSDSLDGQRARAVVGLAWIAAASFCYAFWCHLVGGLYRYVRSRWRIVRVTSGGLPQ